MPSHLYSFSFAPNPGWSHSFSWQPEIRSYLTHLSERQHLAGHLHLGTEVLTARWDAGMTRWRLLTSRGEFTADVLIAAADRTS